jgi:Holliday junction DNA helicase RuvB
MEYDIDTDLDVSLRETDRWITGDKLEGETGMDMSLRPRDFSEFPGQDKVKEKLLVFVKAALSRSEPMDHTLLSGPPGLGKTTLAHLIANALGVDFRSTSGPALHRKGDLAAILTSLKPRSVFFIDEIHRLNRHRNG